MSDLKDNSYKKQDILISIPILGTKKYRSYVDRAEHLTILKADMKDSNLLCLWDWFSNRFLI